jgi:hypothetical protein
MTQAILVRQYIQAIRFRLTSKSINALARPLGSASRRVKEVLGMTPISRTRLFLTAALTLFTSQIACSKEQALPHSSSPSSAPITISIHYFDGLSTRSGPAPREIRYFWYGAPFSLLLTNTSSKTLHLWKPYSPEGDKAIRLEFKKTESDRTGVAHPPYGHMGSNALPKTFTLAPGDSLVYQINLPGNWVVPFTLESVTTCELLVRAVYESGPVGYPSKFDPPDAGAVWQGRVATDWEHVRIVNVSDSTATKGGTPDNLCP